MLLFGVLICAQDSMVPRYRNFAIQLRFFPQVLEKIMNNFVI